jgi:carboxyl-terminal processing protease
MLRRLLVRLPVLCVCVALTHAADEISPVAQSYLDSALNVMQQNFLHKDKIDWPQLRRETLSQAAGAQIPVDTYPAVRFALAKLGDHHSFLQLTPALTRDEASRQPKLANPAVMPATPVRKQTFPFPSPFRTRRLPEGAMVVGSSRPIAQIVIPLFFSENRKDFDDFATKVQAVIADLASHHPCGWIVDLRGNGGGNIWAMLAGVGPILGEGEWGNKRYYEDGKAGVRDDAKDPYYARTNTPPVRLSGTPPVAILIDRDTGSSGEGIAIAFRSRADTRFFGELTYGAATSTFPYPLSDGAQIYLVVGTMLDRSGREYPDGIAPDQEILSETTITTIDPVIRGASEWLSATKACQAAK